MNARNATIASGLVSLGFLVFFMLIGTPLPLAIVLTILCGSSKRYFEDRPQW